ncbi:MAG: hypothetical protein ACLPUG_18475 [Acidimicrobiales bacterium]
MPYSERTQPGVLTTALPVDLADRIRAEAEAQDRTTSNFLRQIIVAHYRELDTRANQTS